MPFAENLQDSSTFGEDGKEAPVFRVEARDIVSIEHPFIIENVEKGAATLGGPSKMKAMVDNAPGSSARLYYRPGDRNTKPLHSSAVETEDVLLEITVPKLKSRKRKRDAMESFTENSSQEQNEKVRSLACQDGRSLSDIKRLVRALKDNQVRYRVDMIGRIKRTHRFRGIPDFVTSSNNAPFMQKMKETILPFDYEKMKAFGLDMSKDVKHNTEIVPPPFWSHHQYPFNYAYHQNPAVRHVLNEDGSVKTINIQVPPKFHSQGVPFDVRVVPESPSSQLQRFETLEPQMQALISELRKLLEQRPIFTRRALQNSLPKGLWDQIGATSGKHAFQYAGYSFNAGPWRDAIVKFGIDPRSDPKYRIYQTMMILSEPESRREAMLETRSLRARTEPDQVPPERSHLFDGKAVCKDCRVWQVCDITDPLLSKILATPNLRPECQVESDGWFWNGMWAKARVLSKVCMNDVLSGIRPRYAMFERVAAEVPDVIHKGESISKPRGTVSADEAKLLTMIRAAAMNKPTLLTPRVQGTVAPTPETGSSGDESVVESEKGDERGGKEGLDVIDPRLESSMLEIAVEDVDME